MRLKAREKWKGLLEPDEGRFEFAWLQRAIDVLHAEGIRVLLTVPTAGPNAWLVNAGRPEDDCRILYEDGTRWEFGGRSMTCPSHPRFQAAARSIATAMAQRFAGHPAVAGWQLDNELGMFGTRCYCPHCVAGFRNWLERKYSDIATLNRRLGMIFGSNEFRSFADVPLPRTRQGLHHHGLKLESQRFLQQVNADFLRLEAAALRAERRYPGGCAFFTILSTMSRLMPKCRAASRLLWPSTLT